MSSVNRTRQYLRSDYLITTESTAKNLDVFRGKLAAQDQTHLKKRPSCCSWRRECRPQQHVTPRSSVMLQLATRVSTSTARLAALVRHMLQLATRVSTSAARHAVLVRHAAAGDESVDVSSTSRRARPSCCSWR